MGGISKLAGLKVAPSGRSQHGRRRPLAWHSAWRHIYLFDLVLFVLHDGRRVEPGREEFRLFHDPGGEAAGGEKKKINSDAKTRGGPSPGPNLLGVLGGGGGIPSAGVRRGRRHQKSSAPPGDSPGVPVWGRGEVPRRDGRSGRRGTSGTRRARGNSGITGGDTPPSQWPVARRSNTGPKPRILDVGRPGDVSEDGRRNRVATPSESVTGRRMRAPGLRASGEGAGDPWWGH
ncbi:hypothetical protein AAG570_004131 [Ranatra chinensis]|uniref:Uncharacterized protein n=1 Tax=Ranatra chinensis TaxID=642074 RepID=A0ABD0Y309_9HEMI